MSTVLQYNHDQKPRKPFSKVKAEAKNPVLTEEKCYSEFMGLSCLVIDPLDDYA